jgi:peroxiredoxin
VLQIGDSAPTFSRLPVFGMPIDTQALLRHRTLAVVFFRYAGSAHTRRTALELHEVFAELDQNDVSLVGVTEGSGKTVRDFVPRYHLLYPVIHDEDEALYRAFQVEKDRGFLRTLLALRPSIVTNYARSLTSGHGALDGPLNRAPAAIVVAPGNRVAWTWYGRSALDLLDVGAMAKAALATRTGLSEGA